jgi:hypothetical protein
MAEVLGSGVIVDPVEAGREIYVEEVVGSHTFERNVVLTFAVKSSRGQGKAQKRCGRSLPDWSCRFGLQTKSLGNSIWRQVPSRSIRKQPASDTDII